MPIGFSKAAATCERLMDFTLRGLNWKTCLVYVGDIIVIEKSIEEPLYNLQKFATGKVETNTSEMFTVL